MNYSQIVSNEAPVLFDYFVQKLAPLVSVLPAKYMNLNSSRDEGHGFDLVNVYLPIAYESELVVRLSILYFSQ